MTVKYYKIPLTYSDGKTENAIIGVFDGDRPDYTADGYGTGTSHSVVEIATYLQEKTGVKMASLTPIMGNLIYPSVESFYKKIIANSNQWYQPTQSFSIDNPHGINEQNGYLYATDGAFENLNAQTNPGVKLTLSSQGGSLWYLNISANTDRGGGQGGNIIDAGPAGYSGSGYRGMFGLVWTDDWNFNLSGTHTRMYKWWGTGPDDCHLEVENKGFFTHLLYLLQQKSLLKEYEYDNPPTDDDPLTPGGTSTPGGGGGTFSDTSDPIDIPGVDNLLSAVDTGFISLFNPSLTELRSLAAFMWSANPTTIEFWKNLIASPLDLILGLSIVPVAVPNGGRASVKVGWIDSGVQMTLAASQYVQVDCGELTVPEYWGSALDYSPNTRVFIMLPFCGAHELDADEVVGKTIRVVYNVDLLTGGLICMIKCGESVLYQYLGQCSMNIPVTSQNFATTLQSIVNIAGSIGVSVASGGMAAPVPPPTASSMGKNYSHAAAQRAINKWSEATQPSVSVEGSGSAGQTAQNVMNSKPHVGHAGALSGPGGLLGVRYPYLIIYRPNQSLADGYNSFEGYPSNITETLGNLSGFTRVESIHLENLDAMEVERMEIESILKSGVYL